MKIYSKKRKVPLWREVGSPSFLRAGSILKGNCSSGPGCNMTVSVAILPALA